MKKKNRISNTEKINLLYIAYLILESGYHDDDLKRMEGWKMEITPTTIGIVYEKLLKEIL